MAEPEDMTLRLLREMRERFDGVEATLKEHTSRFDHLGEQIEAMSGYVTWSMGKSSENRADIESILAEIDDLKSRLKALEERA